MSSPIIRDQIVWIQSTQQSSHIYQCVYLITQSLGIEIMNFLYLKVYNLHAASTTSTLTMPNNHYAP